MLYNTLEGARSGHQRAHRFLHAPVYDKDGRADERKILYGPVGWERDTHGLNNSFRRAFDGWLYVCHGFNNQSTINGADGSSNSEWDT